MERGEYEARAFIDELKDMVRTIVYNVKSDNRTVEEIMRQAVPAPPADPIVGTPCPLCGKGKLIKGRTAYGCSEWKSGCTYRKAFND